MLFTDLNQYIVLGALLVIGWLFGFASHPGGKKWRARYEQEYEDCAAYRHDADSQLRDSNRRIAELERSNATLATQLTEAKAAVPPPPPPPVVEEVPAAPVEHEHVQHEHVEHAPAEMVHADTAHSPAPEPEHETDHAAEADHAHAEQIAAEPAPLTEVAPEVEVAHHDAPADHVDHAPVAAAAALPAFSADAHPVTAEHAEPAHAEHAEHAAEEPKKGWFDQGERDHLARIRGIDGYMQTKLEELGLARFSDVEKLSAEDEMALEQRLKVPVGYIAREQWRDQAALLRAGNVAEHNARFGQI